VVIVADENLETPHLEITRIRDSEMGEHAKPSYERLTEVAATPQPRMGVVVHGEEPAVSGIQRATPMPQREEIAPAPVASVAPVASPPAAPSGGLLGRLFGWFRNPPAPEAAPSERTQPKRVMESGDTQRRDRSSERRSDASRNGGRRNGHDRDGDSRRARQQGSQASKSSQSRSGKSRSEDAQRQARPAQKPAAPAAAKPIAESRAQESRPPRGESTAAPQHEAQRPTLQTPVSAAGAEADLAKPV
jgi:ribonuclease E